MMQFGFDVASPLMLLLLGLAAATAAILGIRTAGLVSGRPEDSGDRQRALGSPLERYARGEINALEFERRRHQLPG